MGDGACGVNPETTTAVVAAIANAECLRSEWCGVRKHPECAAAAATAWFTDWLREVAPNVLAEALVVPPSMAKMLASDLPDALVAALGETGEPGGGDQAKGGQ